MGLLAVALIGCQPAASPSDSFGTESFPAESMAESMQMSEEPMASESASPSP
jgi:hypothetical protein